MKPIVIAIICSLSFAFLMLILLIVTDLSRRDSCFKSGGNLYKDSVCYIAVPISYGEKE